MNTSKNALRLLMAMSFIFILSSGSYAQGRGRRHGGYYGSRPRISVGVGISPYYNYRPALRPRIYYHPPYRLPYPYVRFGPAFGLRIGVLPFGYNQFYIGGNPYYYYDGIYYRPYASGGYTVAPPPLGAMVKHLPAGTKVTVIDGQKYYVLGGTFYQERISANNKVRYEVVGTDGVLNTTNVDADDDDNEAAQAQPAPSSKTTPAAPQDNSKSNATPPADGTVINKLPSGSTAVMISQQRYYVSPAGIYYEEMIDANNKVSYKVAGNTTSGAKSDADSSGTQ